MKNIIIGTAGHVDHGKTTLIKALSGIDTDARNAQNWALPTYLTMPDTTSESSMFLGMRNS